jgi:hypothetical protein
VDTRERSLRMSVEKWFGAARPSSVRVFDFGRVAPCGTRYVRVGVVRPHGSLMIVFFRHPDASWNVYPPGPSQDSIRTYLLAA